MSGLVGALASGLLLLAFGLAGVQFWSMQSGQEGPGIACVIAHFVASVLALVFQAVAERRRGLVGGLCIFGAFVCVIGTVWFWWWL